MAFIQAKGFPLTVGLAKNLPIVAIAAGYWVDMQPAVGAAFVTAESSAGGLDTGHTGIITRVDVRAGYIYVQEQNYRHNMLTEGWIHMSAVTAIVHPLISAHGA